MYRCPHHQSFGHSARLDALEQISSRYEQELPELKVTGIPSSCTVPLLDLSHKLLDCLGLQRLKFDIKTVRLLETLDATSASTQAPGNDSDRRLAPEFKSFMIRFRTRDIAMQVLEIKKEHGKIVFSDIVPSGPTTEVPVFEMLPQYTFRLRKLARDRGNKHGYRHIWVSDGTVLAGEMTPLKF